MKTRSLPSWRLLPGRLAACAVLAAATLLPAGAGAQTPVAPEKPPTPIAFERAVLQAANELFSKIDLVGAPEKVKLVIDPLIDSATGAQSRATRLEGRMIADLVRRSYPRFEVVPFTAASFPGHPVRADRHAHAPEQCRVPGRAQMPTGSGSPSWTSRRHASSARANPARCRRASIRRRRHSSPKARCSPTTPPPRPTSRPAIHEGRRSHPRGVRGARARRGAHQQCDRGLHDAATRRPSAMFEDAQVTAWRRPVAGVDRCLPRQRQAQQREPAAAAFAKVVDFGLQRELLATKFPFRTGTTQFVADRRISGPYQMWLEQIAARTVLANQCLKSSATPARRARRLQ